VGTDEEIRSVTPRRGGLQFLGETVEGSFEDDQLDLWVRLVVLL
jgi:hypothetical protein